MAEKRKGEENDKSAKKRSQNFIPSYTLQWPCLKASKQGSCHTYCEVCRVDISIAHGGRDDCRRHVQSKKHAEYAKLAKAAVSSNMSKFLQKTTQLKYNVIDAEVALVDLCLKHAEVTDMQRQTESYQSSVQFFLKKLPCLIPEEERGKLESEFALYQVTDIRDIKKDRLDEAWAEMGQMKDENGVQMFQVLPKFMLRILTIPHSSAHCERVFSMVRKTHTAFRPNMSSQTLEAILINKSRSGNAGARSYTRKQLDSLKSCYVESLSKHV